MMTIENIRKNHKDYDLIAVDSNEFYWEECLGNWSAVGEYGWNAEDSDIDDADIDHISINEEEKTIYIYLNSQL